MKIILIVFTGHCFLVNLLSIAVWRPGILLLVVEKATCDVEIYPGRRRNMTTKFVSQLSFCLLLKFSGS